MKKATIRDVAEAAGVSISAVSYIMNGSDKKKYSEATVTAVKKAAARLHYVPNSLARGMRSQKAYAIGVVSFFELNNPAIAPFLRAFTEEASALGYSVLLCPSSENFEYLSLATNRKVDGFLFLAPASIPFSERAHIREMQKMNVPFSIVGGSLRDPSVSSILFDYSNSSRLGVQELLARGKKKILYVDEFSPENAKALRERKEGYEEAMLEAGLTPHVLDVGELEENDFSTAEAILTDSAMTARRVLRSALSFGKTVKDDFELIAGSGEEVGRETYLPMTSLDFNYNEASRTALAGMISTAVGPCVIQPILKQGETTKS